MSRHSTAGERMTTRHVVLLTYGEPPTPSFLEQLRYSWRILLGLTRSVAPIPLALLPIVALSRARFRRQLWSRERYGSPLERITCDQAEGVRLALVTRSPDVMWKLHVAYEFRDPLLIPKLESLPSNAAIDIVPMYVADSAFTHEISRRTIGEWKRLAQGRSGPVRVLPALDEDALVEASARHIERQLDARGIRGREWALVLAAHGTLLDPPRPMETGRAATERICHGIVRRLEDRFGTIANGWLNHVYGGRWTVPPVEEALQRVAGAGYRRVVYYPFGFLADNAESELEGRIALRTQPCLEAIHLRCLNADPDFLDMLAAHIADSVDSLERRVPDPTLRFS